MKNRLIVALLLAVVLALPAFAQQTTPTTQDQPAASQPAPSSQAAPADQNAPAAAQPAQAAPADQNAPAAAQPASTAPADQNAPASTQAGASGKQPLQPDTHEGFWGKLNPFARKKYVQRQTQPIRDRVNELDELTSANSKMIKDVDSRAQEGVRLASTKANEADQHAIEAGNKAQLAQQTATQANTRLATVEQVVGNIDQYKAATQTEIRFRPGQSVLSQNAKTALDEMATPLKTQRGYIIEVQGFSSGRGQAAIATSQKMADSVVRYLVLNHEIPVYRIFVVGMGIAPAASADEQGKTKRISGGRVEISLLKNDLEQLASTSSAPAPVTQDQQAPPKELRERVLTPAALPPNSLLRKQEAFFFLIMWRGRPRARTCKAS
jgi:outer membrane protein OmpA-like peptidoglycan-associated protein